MSCLRVQDSHETQTWKAHEGKKIMNFWTLNFNLFNFFSRIRANAITHVVFVVRSSSIVTMSSLTSDMCIIVRSVSMMSQKQRVTCAGRNSKRFGRWRSIWLKCITFKRHTKKKKLSSIKWSSSSFRKFHILCYLTKFWGEKNKKLLRKFQILLNFNIIW